MDNRALQAVWRIPGRSTRVVVNLDAIEQNVRAVRGVLGADGRLMAVVKADAYGHGAVPVAETALRAGAAELGVATIDEATRLREAGITARILVLGPIDPEEVPVATGRGIELALGDVTSASRVARAVERQADPGPLPVHLKVDTGMHRFGVEPERALELARFVAAQPCLKLRGVFTHFARADEEDATPTVEQAERFDWVLGKLQAAGIEPEVVHASNTAATIRTTPVVRGMVRLGIGMYGLNPSGTVPITPFMEPAMTWISRVRRIFTLQPGDGVSYGATYRAERQERAALVPVGYGDGYRRVFSNSAWMGIDGDRCQVRGRVCMDQTVVGIPESDLIALDDTVVIAGGVGEVRGPSFDDLAAWAGTINYELVCGIMPRVPRVYLREGHVVGVADLNGYRHHEESRGRK